MTTPIATGRNRRNVMTGAPDVTFSGGFFLGPSSRDTTKYPKSAAEPTKEVIARLGLKSAGYITSDGVSKSEDRSTEKILDWNLDVIDIVETDYGLQISVTFAEAANAEVLKFIYGEDNVTVDDSDNIKVREGSRTMESQAIMFDIKGKGGMKGRAYADEVQVASIGEITYTKSGLITYPATIDVLSDVNGDYLHTWFSRPGENTGEGSSAEGAGSPLVP